MSLLIARGLTKSYGGVTVLRDVDFAVRGGDVHALVGANGAGKSTLMKILTGAVRPDRGELELSGVPLSLGSAPRVRRSGVSAVYQAFTLAPHLTAVDNVFLGREQRGSLLDGASMRRRAEHLFDGLGVTVDLDVAVRRLSVAQQQMVEIARALAFAAHVIFFDEPTAALSPGEAKRLLDVVRRLRDRGLAIVFTSHRLEEVLELADTMTVLRDGQVIVCRPVSGVARADVIRWMVGRDIAEEFPRRDNVRIGEVVLEARDLVAPPGVRHLNLALHRSEIVALTGLGGAGRSSAALALVGATRARRAATGQILLHGAPVRFRSPAEALENGVAYVTEVPKDHGIFALLSVQANIALSRVSLLTRLGWLLPRRERDAAERSARECRVRAANAAGTLSSPSPQVLILDEPTRGVDVAGRADIYALIDRLSRKGLAILLISSELTEVLGMADRVIVMKHGRIAGEIARAAVTPGRITELATFAS